MGSMVPLQPVKVSHKDKGEKTDFQNQKEEKLVGSSCMLSKRGVFHLNATNYLFL